MVEIILLDREVDLRFGREARGRREHSGQRKQVRTCLWGWEEHLGVQFLSTRTPKGCVRLP